MMLCRSWTVFLLVLMPLFMALVWWHRDANSQKWNAASVVVSLSILIVWLPWLYSYFVSVVLGRKYFVWLDAIDLLHVHRMNWWQKLFDGKEMSSKPLPKGPVFEIWVGGWFRHSKVLNRDKDFGWKIKVVGTWFSCLPKYLVLTSIHDHHSIRLTFSRWARDREIDYECLARALTLVDTHHDLLTALHDLERRRANDEAPAVAGQVGVNA